MGRTGSRDRIVAAGLDRFAELGFRACGVKELTEAAGVLKGSFYNYFESKEQLAVEVLGVYLAETRLDILEDARVPPLARIRSHFEHIAGIYEHRGYSRGCLMNKFANEVSSAPMIDRDLAMITVRWTVLLAKVIRQGQKGGEIAATGDPEQIARFLLYAWNGAVTFMRVSSSRTPLDDFFGVAFERLVPAGSEPVPA